LYDETIRSPNMADPNLAVIHVAAPVREQVLQNLRRAIVEGRFAPEQRLIEREIIEMTGASRTSVREALRELAAEGLVKTIPNRGMFVSVPTPEEAEELYAVRQSLESLAVGWFVERASPADVEALRNAIEAIERSTSIREMLGAKDRFYATIGSRSPTIARLLSTLNARVALLRSLSLGVSGRMEESKQEMRRIYDAIARGEREVAEAAARSHVERSGRLALEALAQRATEPEEAR
jgi:GntR family transcriptional regulator, trigonelline degradation regulator